MFRVSRADQFQLQSISIMAGNTLLGAYRRVFAPTSQLWVCSLEFVPMLEADARAELETLINALDGQANFLAVYPPHRKLPAGSAAGLNQANSGMTNWDGSTQWDGTTSWQTGSPYVYLAEAARSNKDSIVVKGLTANQAISLKAGDFLELNGNLHQVKHNASSDNSGQARVVIQPKTRRGELANVRINLDRPRGRFQLASSDAASISYATLTSQASLQLTEVPYVSA